MRFIITTPDKTIMIYRNQDSALSYIRSLMERKISFSLDVETSIFDGCNEIEINDFRGNNNE